MFLVGWLFLIATLVGAVYIFQRAYLSALNMLLDRDEGVAPARMWPAKADWRSIFPRVQAVIVAMGVVGIVIMVVAAMGGALLALHFSPTLL